MLVMVANEQLNPVRMTFFEIQYTDEILLLTGGRNGFAVIVITGEYGEVGILGVNDLFPDRPPVDIAEDECFQNFSGLT